MSDGMLALLLLAGAAGILWLASQLLTAPTAAHPGSAAVSGSR